MILLGASETSWLTVVDAVFDKACKNGGDARLPHELELRFERHGELTTETLSAGTSLFFPLEGGPMRDRRRAKRSKDVCAIMGEQVHLTLTRTSQGIRISSFKRMRSPSFA